MDSFRLGFGILTTSITRLPLRVSGRRVRILTTWELQAGYVAPEVYACAARSSSNESQAIRIVAVPRSVIEWREVRATIGL
jgi:hypothetical protein